MSDSASSLGLGLNVLLCVFFFFFFPFYGPACPELRRSIIYELEPPDKADWPTITLYPSYQLS